MSAGKYPSIFSRQMEGTVCLFPNSWEFNIKHVVYQTAFGANQKVFSWQVILKMKCYKTNPLT